MLLSAHSGMLSAFSRSISVAMPGYLLRSVEWQRLELLSEIQNRFRCFLAVEALYLFERSNLDGGYDRTVRKIGRF